MRDCPLLHSCYNSPLNLCLQKLGITLPISWFMLAKKSVCANFYFISPDFICMLKFLDMCILNFMFVSFCMPLCVIEIWFDELENDKYYERTLFSDHKAIKQMCCLKMWDTIII